MKEMRQWWDEAMREVEEACTTETEAVSVFMLFLISSNHHAYKFLFGCQENDARKKKI